MLKPYDLKQTPIGKTMSRQWWALMNSFIMNYNEGNFIMTEPDALALVRSSRWTIDQEQLHIAL